MLWIIWVGWFFVALMIVITQRSLVIGVILFLLMVALPLLLIMWTMTRRLAQREAERQEQARINAEHLARNQSHHQKDI